MHDLLLRGGRVLDPGRGSDYPADVVFSGGLVSEIGDNIDAAQAAEVRQVEGCFVVPGLIDLHTHVYWGGTSLGVDAGSVARTSEPLPSSMPGAPARVIMRAFCAT